MIQQRLFGGKVPSLFLLAGAVVGLFFLVSFVRIAPLFSSVQLTRAKPLEDHVQSSNCVTQSKSSSLEKPAARCLECDLLLLNNLKNVTDVELSPCDIRYYKLADFGRWLASRKAHGQNLAVTFGDSLMRIQTNLAFTAASRARNLTNLGIKNCLAAVLCCNVEATTPAQTCEMHLQEELPGGVSTYAYASQTLQSSVHDWCWIYHAAATPAVILAALPEYFSNTNTITPASVVMNPALHVLRRNNTRRLWVNNLNKLADLVEAILRKQDSKSSQEGFGEKTRFLYHTGTAVYENAMAFFTPLYRKEREVILNRDLERLLTVDRPGLFTLVDANRLSQGYWYRGLINPPLNDGEHPQSPEFYALMNIVDWNFLLRNLSVICVKDDSPENMELQDWPRGEERDKLAADFAYPMPRFAPGRDT